MTEEKRCYDKAAGEYCQSLTFRDAHGRIFLCPTRFARYMGWASTKCSKSTHFVAVVYEPEFA
jgi:hypothetical protein